MCCGNWKKPGVLLRKIKLSIGKSETKPQFIRLVAPNDIVVVVLFTISVEGFNARMWLCIPYLLLEPIRDKLSYKHLRDSEMENLWSSKLQEILNDAPVKVTARIGNITQSIGDILNIQEGDLILLDTGPPDLIPVFGGKCAQIPRFRGHYGWKQGGPDRGAHLNIKGMRKGINRRLFHWRSLSEREIAMSTNEKNGFRFKDAGKDTSVSDLDFILDIPLEVTVELGRTKMLINDLLQLSQGSVVELTKFAGQTLDLLANSRLVARGEVVVVKDHYALRITEIVSPMERIEKLK
jgi:flagellar motor switch protein FliN/FliY